MDNSSRSISPVRGFFAYPSQPPNSADSINYAVRELNKSGAVELKTWAELQIGGKIIIQDICGEIDKAPLFCADITGLNPNVLFELGYAIGKDKRIWLLLDSSYTESRQLFDQFRILTTIGYCDYKNSRNIIDGFYKDLPYDNLEDTIFQKSIKPQLEVSDQDFILYIRSAHENEAGVRIVQGLNNSPLKPIIDDPAEAGTPTLQWYGGKIFSSRGVLCHLSSEARQGSRLSNARCALVAGLAHAMNKPLLLLQEGNYLAPLDYRDLAKQYDKSGSATQYLKQWLQPLEQQFKGEQLKNDSYASVLNLAIQLKSLDLGEYIAENEAGTLLKYFVETTSFREAIKGQQSIFVGRKGTGKSANFLKLESELQKIPHTLVCSIRPVSYELEGILKLMGKFQDKDSKGHALESLWKFLLYTEIVNAAANEFRSNSQSIDKDALALLRYIDKHPEYTEPFAIRFERCIEKIIAFPKESVRGGQIEASRFAIAELLHKGAIRELREILLPTLKSKNRIAILIDNLDKAWHKHSDIPVYAEVLLGLLSAGVRIGDDFRRQREGKAELATSIALFLRSDIFFQILKFAREPDKISFSRIRWDDRDLLLQVVEERFTVATANKSPPAELWEKFFCPTVQGKNTRDFLISHVLPRPRDLIFFVKAAISTAVNRRHGIVEEEDILTALKEYSAFAMQSILVENGVSVEQLERIIFEFIGGSKVVSLSSARNKVESSGISSSTSESVVYHLCKLGFFGIEIKDGKFRLIDDPSDFDKNFKLGQQLATDRGSEMHFEINMPFHAFLELTN